MMLSIKSSDEDLIGFVEEWVNDLAKEDYEAAYKRTGHDPYYEWTPGLIESVINGYGLPEPHPSGEVFKVTPIKEAKGDKPRIEVDRGPYNDNRFGYVFYDLPLNGEWSDLTASFRFEKQGKNLKAVLEQIHVM
jgi:hypothetical protein